MRLQIYWTMLTNKLEFYVYSRVSLRFLGRPSPSRLSCTARAFIMTNCRWKLKNVADVQAKSCLNIFFMSPLSGKRTGIKRNQSRSFQQINWFYCGRIHEGRFFVFCVQTLTWHCGKSPSGRFAFHPSSGGIQIKALIIHTAAIIKTARPGVRVLK